MSEQDIKPWRFQPGKSGNPNGKPKMTTEERAMRDNFKKSFAMLGTKTIAEIEALAKDKNQPAPIALAAKALSHAFNKGNPTMYREIWDRTIGKVVQDIHVSQRPYEQETDEELDRRLKAAERGEALPPRTEE